jgi:hypothetical protein
LIGGGNSDWWAGPAGNCSRTPARPARSYSSQSEQAPRPAASPPSVTRRNGSSRSGICVRAR